MISTYPKTTVNVSHGRGIRPLRPILGSALRIAAVVSIGVGSGCGENPSIDEARSIARDDQPSQATIASSAADREGITVTPVDRAGYDDVLESHQGKIVLVDFWATWCPSCVEEFAHTVAIGRNADPAELVVVSVSMDEPEDEAKVLKFLQRQTATFDNLLSTYGVGQEGFAAFELADGSIPHYKIYDRSGVLRQTADTNEDVDEILAKLLAE